jgi:hypothetical protein
MSKLEQNLRRSLKGEVLFDRASRGRYSTDASIYQIEPVGDPASPWTWRATPRRGGGTSQCGQTVGEALVIDCSKPPARGGGFDVEATHGRRCSPAWCSTT